MERISSNYKKNRIVLLVFSFLWIAAVTVTLLGYRNMMGKKSYGNSDREFTLEINKDTVISQTLKVEEGTDAVSVLMVTYARRNKGTLNIRVTDDSGKKVYADKSVPVSHIQDNAFLTVSLNETLHNQKIVVRLSSDCKGGEGINGEAPGVYCSTYNDFQGEPFTVNGIENEGSLCIRYLVPDEHMEQFYRISVASSIILLTIMMIVLLLLEPKYEVFFAGLALALGVVFMFIITPMSVPDEKTHYERSLQLSNRIIFRKGNTVETTYLDYAGFYGHHNNSGSYEKLLNEFSFPAKNQDEIKDLNRIPKYCYLGYYVPQAIGIATGRLFGLNMLKTFYLGRFTNLLFYVLCIFVAVRKTPVHKTLFGILASMPIFIQQASSYSYDGFIFGLTFVVAAYFLKWFFVDEDITVFEFAVAFVANQLLAPAKSVYCVFSFLYWFIPEKRFGTRLKKLVICTLICFYPLKILYEEIWKYRIKVHIQRIFGLAFSNPSDLLLLPAASGKTGLVSDWVAPLNEPYTFTYVLQHPMETIHLFLYTIRYSIKLWFYGSIGRTMSGLSLILPLRLVQSFPLLLLICSLRKEEHVEPIWLKALFAVLCIVSAMMTLFGMLLGWTSTQSDMIEGIQGRYFSPLLPYFFPIFNNGRITISEKADRYLIFTHIILMFITIVYILSYTFVN